MATLQEIILEAKNNNNFIYRGCAFENYDLVPTLARKLKIDVSFDQYNIYSDVVKKAAERGVCRSRYEWSVRWSFSALRTQY